MKVQLENTLKISEIGDEHLQEVANKLGSERLLEEINNKINYSSCRVDFIYSDIKVALNAGDYRDLLLMNHELVIKKPKNEKAFRKLIKVINKEFEVYSLKETSNEVIFEFSADEGPYASTINEIMFGVNKILCPYVINKLNDLNIKEYKIIFQISKAS